MRRLLVAAVIAAAAGAVNAPASAACDPKRPVCLTDCVVKPPPGTPGGSLFEPCPR